MTERQSTKDQQQGVGMRKVRNKEDAPTTWEVVDISPDSAKDVDPHWCILAHGYLIKFRTLGRMISLIDADEPFMWDSFDHNLESTEATVEERKAMAVETAKAWREEADKEQDDD